MGFHNGVVGEPGLEFMAAHKGKSGEGRDMFGYFLE